MKKECAGRDVLAMRTCLLCELAQARRPRNDLAHLIRSDFVATEPEKFTRHALNLVHAQTKRHQPGTDRHQASAHQPRETATAAGSCDRSFGTRNLIDQGLNFVGGSLVAEKTENDADGFFSDSAIDAGLGGQPSYQFVHICPVPNNRHGPVLLVNLILIACDLKYKRPTHRDDFDSPSVAAMQDSMPVHAHLLRCVLDFFSLRSD